MVARIYIVIHEVRLLGVLLCCVLLFATGLAHADSYQVKASVPYPPPTQPATIDGGLDGMTVATALQTHNGTCQVQNPAVVVSVWRNGSPIGSTPCTGTYSLPVMLKPGVNTLIVRTANASALYGPDSAPITITLVLPPDPTPTTPDPPVVTPVQQQTPAKIEETTNAGAAAELMAATKEPFSVMTSNNDVTLNIAVGGGVSPYTITLDWGDGSVETHTVDQAGTYAFTHAYVSAGNFTVRGTAQDVLGASTQFSHAVISQTPLPDGSKALVATIEDPKNPLLTFVAKHWKPIAGTTGAVVIAGGGYMIGAHRAVGQSVVQSTRAVRARAKSIPKVRKH